MWLALSPGALIDGIAQEMLRWGWRIPLPQARGMVLVALAVKLALDEERWPSPHTAASNGSGTATRVTVLEDVVILTAVGAGMRGTPGVAGRVFSQMGAHGVNVLSIAQGSSECSISFVVAEADMRRAVVALHDLALVHVGEAVEG